MSLDQNLFTLFLTNNKDNPQVIDLVDPQGTIHYRKQRLPTIEYKAEVYDPISESLLITATAPSAVNKFKTLELCNPTKIVELKYTGTLTFRWGFTWEEHEFEWKREECYMLRKPDPPVLVAVTKELPGRLKTQSVQILDYNLNRFDIEDRKGLEIVILTALLTFQDANETSHSKSDNTTPSSPTSAIARIASISVAGMSDKPPPPPPKPAPKTGIDRIAEMQAATGDYNEVTIEDEGSIEDYARYCSKLLEDDAMLFITVKSAEADQVPRVLQVVEETKRIRHKSGVSEEEELHQYVLYDTIQKKGPKRINLDDDKNKNKYAPPNSLTIHLSKISMPELQPKASVHDKPRKEVKKKEEKQASVPPPAKLPQSSNAKLKPPSKPTRPGSSPPSNRVSAHQVHPNQPSPSPSQLNNPSVYAAPPPNRPNTRPKSSQGHGPSSSFPTLSIPGRSYNQQLNIRPWQAQQSAPPILSPTAQKPVSSASTVVAGLLDKIRR